MESIKVETQRVHNLTCCRFYKASKHGKEYERDQDAKRRLKKYFSHVLNGVCFGMLLYTVSEQHLDSKKANELHVTIMQITLILFFQPIRQIYSYQREEKY